MARRRNSTARRKTTTRQRFGTQGKVTHVAPGFGESVNRRTGEAVRPNPWSIHDGIPRSYTPPPGWAEAHDQALRATQGRPLGVRTGLLYPLATRAGGWCV